MAYRGSFTFGGFGLTPWVQRLIIANTVIFLLNFLSGGAEIGGMVNYYLAFVPLDIFNRPWSVVTYMFAHGGIWHLFFNMLGLFFFGPPLEARWGSREFIKFYLICGVGGAALAYAPIIGSPHGMVIGASGAVFGVMLAFAMNWPEMPIYIWGIFPIQARVLVLILVVFSLLSAFGGSNDGTAHFAHLGGFAAGFLYLKLDRHNNPMTRLKKLSAKRRMTVVPGSRDAPARSAPQPSQPPKRDPNEDKLLDELDRVLEKISTDGMSSLTASERRLLDDVSRKYRRD